jgi:hypothetical protein
LGFALQINGEARELDIDGDMPLPWALRDELRLMATSFVVRLMYASARHSRGRLPQARHTGAHRRTRRRVGRNGRTVSGKKEQAHNVRQNERAIE